jgi:hypothetical protein
VFVLCACFVRAVSACCCCLAHLGMPHVMLCSLVCLRPRACSQTTSQRGPCSGGSVRSHFSTPIVTAIAAHNSLSLAASDGEACRMLARVYIWVDLESSNSPRPTQQGDEVRSDFKVSQSYCDQSGSSKLWENVFTELPAHLHR